MRRKRPAHQKLDTAKKIDPDWILNIKENIAAPSIILRSSLIMPVQAMRRSLLIHLHISESKWYQRKNKNFLVGSRSFQNLVFKASHRRLWRQPTYAATQFFTDSKIFWKIPGRRKGPLQGIFVEILPCSLFRFRFTYRATNGIRRCPAYKTPPVASNSTEAALAFFRIWATDLIVRPCEWRGSFRPLGTRWCRAS